MIDQVEFALQVMLLGFSVVLLTLFLLFLIIHFLGRVLSPPDIVPSKNLNYVTDVWDGPSPRVAAVITASIYSYLFNNHDGSYTIKSIEPVHRSSPGPAVCNWTMQGRKELLNAMEEIEQYRRKKSAYQKFPGNC